MIATTPLRTSDSEEILVSSPWIKELQLNPPPGNLGTVAP